MDCHAFRGAVVASRGAQSLAGTRCDIGLLRRSASESGRLCHDTGLHGRASRCPKGASVAFAHVSVNEMDEIASGKRKASRLFEVRPTSIGKLRKQIGLRQSKFAALLRIDVGTLRNWEQGMREPTGPAKALLTAIARDPEHVLKALAA